MKRKILGFILFLYFAFIASNLLGFKILRPGRTFELSESPVESREMSQIRFPDRNLAAEARAPRGPSALTEGQVDLFQDNFKSLKGVDMGKVNQKDLKALVRSVLDERPIQVEFKKEEPSDWLLIYTGIMQSGPVALVIFILGLFFASSQPPTNSTVQEIESDSSSIRLLVFNRTRKWDNSAREWTVHRNINFGFMKFEKTYQEKPGKRTA